MMAGGNGRYPRCRGSGRFQACTIRDPLAHWSVRMAQVACLTCGRQFSVRVPLATWAQSRPGLALVPSHKAVVKQNEEVIELHGAVGRDP